MRELKSILIGVYKGAFAVLVRSTPVPVGWYTALLLLENPVESIIVYMVSEMTKFLS